MAKNYIIIFIDLLGGFCNINNNIKFVCIIVLVFSVSFYFMLSLNSDEIYNKIICDLDNKYFPGDINIYHGEHHDFLKAIWEDGTVRDYHIVVDDCKVEEFYPSSKKFNMSYDYYVAIKNKFGHFN